MSENDKIGVLPPGPISNHELFTIMHENILEIKPDLELNKEYRGVSKEVWALFHKMYGGGPIIVREDLDIYSSDLTLLMAKRANNNAI